VVEKLRTKIILSNFPSNFLNENNKMENDLGYNPSFSLIALGSWLEIFGYDVQLIDMYADMANPQEFIELIARSELLFFGCTIHTENSDLVLNVIRGIKKLNPHITTVAGGPHPTFCYEELMSNNLFDYICLGEGESTVLELAEVLASGRLVMLDGIKGLVYRFADSTLKTTERRQFIMDLDLLPILKREFFDIGRYGIIINIISGRGCPGGCIYCAANVLSGYRYRTRLIENIYMEIVLLKHIIGNRIKCFYFVDDTFTVSKKRVLKFIELLKLHKMPIVWWCQTRVDTIDFSLIDALATSGCAQLLYGIESGNQEVIKRIGKGISLEKAWKLMEYTYHKGISIQVSFILGHFCDTVDTMEDTYNFIVRIYNAFGAEIAIYLNTPFPGTYQAAHSEKLGLRVIENDYSKYTNLIPIIETENFTVYDQRRIHNKCMQFFSRKRRLEEIKKSLIDDLENQNAGELN
jgi:radical SAM superfamily enzyme YgiQ (UPF0313 family)